MRFNPPPNWPQPPAGWAPDEAWRPDPTWGPAPPGWAFWVEDPVAPTPRHRPAGGPRVFISYRRSDCQPQANGLYDGLSHRLPAASIFMDIDSIPPGADFEQHIRREIEICDLVLVMIGDNWLDPAEPGVGRRIDAPDDFVRLEIESALASPQVRVLPILVEGASMPRVSDLPPTIRDLARFNAIELDDRRWTSDVRRLTATIEELTESLPAEPPAPSGPAVAPVAAFAPGGGATALALPQPTRTSAVGWIMVALPLLTFGLADWVPALWAGVRRRQDKRFRTTMFVFAGVIGLLTYVAIGFVGSSSRDSVWSDVGVAVWLACIVVATVVAVVNRKSSADLPGAAAELQRQRAREQYRAMARRDPGLARQLAVGRPDLARRYTDGGLLDLNALPLAALVHFAPMAADDARRVVDARQRLGRLSSLDELSRAGLSETALARLRETAVFL